MLRIQGNARKLCDGLTRRDWLHVGGLGMMGLSLEGFLRHQAAAAAASTKPSGRARACILLFPYGSPPQHETFDPKPDAPAEVQGELKSISSSVPGVRICEALPKIARVMDRVTVVRSMCHPYPAHGVAYAVTGIPTYTPALETRPRDPQHWPFIGSVVDYLEDRRKKTVPDVPRNLGLPWLLNSRTNLNVSAGPYAAFLGQAYDPVWAEFDGVGTKLAPKYFESQAKEFLDPYAGLTAQSRFQVSNAGHPRAELPAERLRMRRSLLAQFDQAKQALDAGAAGQVMDRHREEAFALLTSGKLRRALDITLEPLAVRERYGMTLFGQSCLAARRVIEAGGKFVTVFWDGFGVFASCAWDTHANHYPRLKEYLLPGFDQAYSALLLDLEARGLLDETLVLWMSEHGRTPRINSKPKGAGRDHWSRAYSVALAGGGVPRGAVVGRSDRIGGDVQDAPVSPKDILATTFHLLGVDPRTTVADSQGRPLPIAGDGQVRKELLA